MVEGSARSAHSNAYFYGFFKAKRIVLYDTLIKGYSLEKTKSNETIEKDDSTSTDEQEKSKKGCDSEEVLAVLCHEFGHWSLSHNLINLCISFVCVNIELFKVYL